MTLPAFVPVTLTEEQAAELQAILDKPSTAKIEPKDLPTMMPLDKAVLDAVNAAAEPQTPHDIAIALGQPTPDVRDSLLWLIKMGFVSMTVDRKVAKT